MQQRTLELRCSGLDLAWKCGESAVLSGEPILIDRSGSAADMGSAAHKYAQHLDDEEQPDIVELAERFDVDADELEMLCHMARKIYHERLKVWLAGGETEIELEHTVEFPYGGYTHLRLRGKLDVSNVRGNRAFQGDYKFGYVEMDCTQQRRGYGFLALKHHPDCNQVWSAAIYVRLNLIDAGTSIWSRAELDDWFADLLWRVRNSIGKFNPDHYCRLCQRQYDCEGRNQFVRSTLTVFGMGMDMDIEQPPHILGPRLAVAVRRSKLIGKVCDELKEVAHEYAKKHKFFPTGDGHVFELRKSQRQPIDPRKAWPVLTQNLTD